MDTGQKMDTGLSTEEKAKQITKTVITKEAQKTARTTAPNGMPVYDINEPWVQQYIADFGCEPSFF